MENKIGTNDIGAVIGACPEEWAAYHQQEAAAHDAAMAQQIQGQVLLGALLGAPRPLSNQDKTAAARVKAARDRAAADKAEAATKQAAKKQATQKGPGEKKLPKSYVSGIDNLKGAAKTAKEVGTKAVARGSAYRQDKPLAVIAGDGILGCVGIVNDVVLGVMHKSLTAAQLTKVKAHNKAIALTREAANTSIKAGNKALAEGKRADAAAKKVEPIFNAVIRKPKQGASSLVHGILGWGDAYEYPTHDWSDSIVGADDPSADLGEYADLYDPAYWRLPPLKLLFTDLDGDNPDPNLKNTPPAPLYTDIGGANPAPDLKAPLKGGGKLSQSDAQVVWQRVPADGVVWDGSGRVPLSLGSWLSFYGPQSRSAGVMQPQFGVVWGYHADGWQNGESKWTKRFGQADITGNDNRDDLGVDDANAAAQSLASDPRNNKTGMPYGPLIGNPNGPLAGLQYAHADGKWFWQVANAPANQIAQLNAVIVEQNAATLKAANDAVNAANKALADSNATVLATDNAIIVAFNADIMQQVKALAEAKIKQDAANALRADQDAADLEATRSKTEEERIKADELERQAQAKDVRDAAQREAEERTRAAQFEADMMREQVALEKQQAQFEQQYALAQQQAENQFALAQQQTEAQLAPQQMQMDAQMQQAMLQMLMQPAQPQGAAQPQGQPQAYDDAQALDQMLTALLLMQMQGIDQPQADPPTPVQFDPAQFDPAQLPGSFDVAEYYGW